MIHDDVADALPLYEIFSIMSGSKMGSVLMSIINGGRNVTSKKNNNIYYGR